MVIVTLIRVIRYAFRRRVSQEISRRVIYFFEEHDTAIRQMIRTLQLGKYLLQFLSPVWLSAKLKKLISRSLNTNWHNDRIRHDAINMKNSIVIATNASRATPWSVLLGARVISRPRVWVASCECFHRQLVTNPRQHSCLKNSCNDTSWMGHEPRSDVRYVFVLVIKVSCSRRIGQTSDETLLRLRNTIPRVWNEV